MKNDRNQVMMRTKSSFSEKNGAIFAPILIEISTTNRTEVFI